MCVEECYKFKKTLGWAARITVKAKEIKIS